LTECRRPTANMIRRDFPGWALGGTDLAAGVHPYALHPYFFRRDLRVAPQNVLPIEFRDRQAELAVLQLGVEVGGVQQQVGAMQRHAEVNAQHTRGDHGDPRREIAMMHMEVRHAASLKQQRVVHPQPGVQQRPHPPACRLISLRQNTSEEARQQGKFPHTQPRRRQQKPKAQRLQAQRFCRENCQFTVERRSLRPSRAAWDHTHSSAPEFLDFLHKVRFNRRGQLIGEVGNRGHQCRTDNGAGSCWETMFTGSSAEAGVLSAGSSPVNSK